VRERPPEAVVGVVTVVAVVAMVEARKAQQPRVGTVDIVGDPELGVFVPIVEQQQSGPARQDVVDQRRQVARLGAPGSERRQDGNGEIGAVAMTGAAAAEAVPDPDVATHG